MYKLDECNSDSLFYCDIKGNSYIDEIIKVLQEYSNQNNKQVYILTKALGVTKPYEYGLSDIAYILIPKHPILLLNYGHGDSEQLEDYYYDFKEDLGHLADKYGYDRILGRARKWPQEWIIYKSIAEFSLSEYLDEEIKIEYQRKIDLLISLLIGSINSIEKVGMEEPITLLDKVKHKIILFDGKQSRFIYQHSEEKIITIQGLAGTGKTELLLHKLKEIYSNSKDSRIAFTCFNKVLANDMKSRIPEFFNYMKVDEQIDWNNRLHVFSSWGSLNYPESGMYSYICNLYKIPFFNYRENHNFEKICFDAYNLLQEKENFEPCFDYIFIDESQDFGDNFIKLCSKICTKTIFLAGDIFQNIYDTNINNNINPTYLLNKCYRTDPKTLMFAHAVGMGLYEKPPLNWLEDSGWEACGYNYKRDSNQFILSRQPLRRFEDLDAKNTLRFIECESNYSREVVNLIDNLIKENPNINPDDIGIVILDDYKRMCMIADKISYEVGNTFGWYCSKGYETKIKEKNYIYISNINNIKGLEFPFIICVVPGYISDNIKYRNSIYMALTRSFLTTFFLVNNENRDFISIYNKAIDNINNYGIMVLDEPSDKQKEEMHNKIKITLSKQKKSLEEIINNLCNKQYTNVSKKDREHIIVTLQGIAKNSSEEQIIKKAKAFIEEVLEVD